MPNRLKRIDASFIFVYDDVPRPAPFTIKLISERVQGKGMPDILTYEATLPAVPAGTDVESQLFDVSVGGEAQPTQTLAAGVTTATFDVEQGSDVTLSLVYLDDGGNRSAPRTQEFVANDTIPPDAPGAFGEIKLVGEHREP